MRDEHRLRAAQVRVRRHQRVAGRARPDRASARDERRDRALDLRDAPLQVQPQIERRPARCATGRCAGGGRRRRCARRARARRTCGRPRRPCRVRVDERRIAHAAREDLLEAVVDRRGVGGRQHAGARERLRPRQAAASRRLRTAADRSGTTRRTRRAPASGSPANRPDQRCAIRIDRSAAASRAAVRRAQRCLGGGDRASPSRSSADAANWRADDAAVALEQLEPHGAGDARLHVRDERVDRLARRREPVAVVDEVGVGARRGRA